MIPFELLLGAWVMTKGGWSTVWIAFGLIVLVEVVLRGFFGIDLGAYAAEVVESLIRTVIDGGSQ